MLCGVEVKYEHMSLESFAEVPESLCCSDIGQRRYQPAN